MHLVSLSAEHIGIAYIVCLLSDDPKSRPRQTRIMAQYTGPTHPHGPPKQFVLCFDGTGNKFAGDESDSNVLKIFRVCSQVILLPSTIFTRDSMLNKATFKL